MVLCSDSSSFRVLHTTRGRLLSPAKPRAGLTRVQTKHLLDVDVDVDGITPFLVLRLRLFPAPRLPGLRQRSVVTLVMTGQQQEGVCEVDVLFEQRTTMKTSHVSSIRYDRLIRSPSRNPNSFVGNSRLDSGFPGGSTTANSSLPS